VSHPANELTARWAQAVGGGSFAVSGAGVWPLLALLARAAGGPARDELERAAGVGAAIDLPFSVWFADTVTPSAWWRETVPASAWGLLADADLDAWVREQTGGLIERLPVEIGPDVLMLLVSAFAVRAPWRVPFTSTILDWVDGRRVTALMHSDPELDHVRVLAGANGPVTAVAIQAEDELTVEVALSGHSPLDALLTLLGTYPSAPVENGPGVEVGVASYAPGLQLVLPRFTVHSSYDLLEHAAVFGLETATDTRFGHFPRITDTPLAVGAAKQSVMAAFTEEGFEAAAATAVSMLAGGGLPPHDERSIAVTIDRPFAFVAWRRGIALVAGCIEHAEDFPPPEHAITV